jgi:DNA polymerase
MSNQMLIDSLRGMICAPAGWHVVDVDLSNIELRLALWYAGDQERLQVLREGGDLYLFNARTFFGIPADATKKSHPGERQTSKQLTLGGQYGIGGRKFWLTNESFIAKGELPPECRMTEEQCHGHIQTYRRGNPLLAGRGGLWEQLETGMRSAMHQPGTVWSAAGGKVQFFHDGQKLDICLPSGRTLPHWHPRFEDGDIVFSRAKNGRMMRQKTYGGAITEIVSQSAGRDILTAAEADIERELTDCHLILDVYDSVLFLAPAAVAEQRKEQALAILRREREWTTGLPLDAEGYSAERMKK